MITAKIMLSSINDVKNLVNIVNKYDFDIDLISDRYVVDAKSIMGIFSLDLTKTIKVEAHTDDFKTDIADALAILKTLV